MLNFKLAISRLVMALGVWRTQFAPACHLPPEDATSMGEVQSYAGGSDSETHPPAYNRTPRRTWKLRPEAGEGGERGQTAFANSLIASC